MTIGFRQEYYNVHGEERDCYELEEKVVNNELFLALSDLLVQVLKGAKTSAAHKGDETADEDLEPIGLEIVARHEKPTRSMFIKYQRLHLRSYRALQKYEARLDQEIGKHSITRPTTMETQAYYKVLLRAQFFEFLKNVLPATALEIPNLKHTKKYSRGYLPRASTIVLRKWLFEHFSHPYPSQHEKEQLALQTNLKPTQVNYWFINARVRIWKPILATLN